MRRPPPPPRGGPAGAPVGGGGGERRGMGGAEPGQQLRLLAARQVEALALGSQLAEAAGAGADAALHLATGLVAGRGLHRAEGDEPPIAARRALEDVVVALVAEPLLSPGEVEYDADGDLGPLHAGEDVLGGGDLS